METTLSEPPQPTPLPAAIYARISRDREGGGLGVQRQEADCRELAKRLGWEVTAVFVDNDISAYSGKRRPQYEAMLEAIRAGRVQGIVAWHTDRLHRRPVELEAFITLAESTDLQVQTVKAGDLNLSTPAGRMVARMLGAAARHEVDNTRVRLRSQKAQAAAAGKYRGGRRPFGYERDGRTIREHEAEHLRHACRELLAGRSLAAVTRELKARGSLRSTWRAPLVVKKRHEWDANALRAVLLRPRNAGFLHTGTVTAPTIVHREAWPAIVDEDTWRGVHSLLTSPSRLSRKVGSEPHWLGSGIFTCGLCGSVMRVTGVGATPSRPNYKRAHHYRCSEVNHLTSHVGHTDDYVRGVVAEMVRDPRVVAQMTAGEGDAMRADRDQRSKLLTRLEQIGRDYDDGVIDGPRYKSASDRATSQLIEVEERLAQGVQQATVNPIFNAPDPGQRFLDSAIDIQRAVVRSLLRVEIVPAARQGISWSPDRVRLSSVTDAA